MVGTAPEPLEQGPIDGVYPLNDQADPNFNVGGVRRILPDELQLEQLVSYIDATYPRPSGADDDAEALDRYLALLPDRITHAAMLMLGSAVDHTMPGVAYPGNIKVEDSEFGQVFTPAEASKTWVVSLWPTPGLAREFAWRPEVAGAAQLSGARIVDVDKLGALEPAVAYAREQGASKVAVWVCGEVDVPSSLNADAYIFTWAQPTQPATDTACTLVQVSVGEMVRATRAKVRQYYCRGAISTPAEARRRVSDVADFLTALSPPEDLSSSTCVNS